MLSENKYYMIPTELPGLILVLRMGLVMGKNEVDVGIVFANSLKLSFFCLMFLSVCPLSIILLIIKSLYMTHFIWFPFNFISCLPIDPT